MENMNEKDEIINTQKIALMVGGATVAISLVLILGFLLMAETFTNALSSQGVRNEDAVAIYEEIYKENVALKEENKILSDGNDLLKLENAYNTSCVSSLRKFSETEVNMLAKLVWGEARGIKSYNEKASVVWCVLNRMDSETFPDTISGVVTQQNQFHGYVVSNPVTDELKNLVENVLCAYEMERLYGDSSGRSLPEEYLYFHGDGESNWFRVNFKDNGQYYQFD